MSDALRYPIWPVPIVLAAPGSNFTFGYAQVFVGRAFQAPGFTHKALIGVAVVQV